MAESPEHKENMYSLIAFILMFVSILIGGYFYMTKAKNMIEEPLVNEVTPTVAEELRPTLPELDAPVIAEEAEASFKVAVPNEAFGILTDSEGRSTGQKNGAVVNDIPLSEYTPDNVAGTVTWILVAEPEPETYTLNIVGTSDKAVALYVKGKTGVENLELLDISDATVQQRTFQISINPTIPENPIVVQ